MVLCLVKSLIYQKKPELIPIPLVLLDSEYRVRFLTKEFEKLFGYSQKELANEKIDNYIVSEEKKKEAEELNEKIRDGYISFETVRYSKDNKEIPVMVTGKKIEIDEEDYYYVIYQDTRDKKEMQEREDFFSFYP